tara:strand:- start:68 stop:661 length:594 start_codon:yes stop_codon:yes gene_type:complete
MNVDAMEKWVWNTLQSGLSNSYTYHNVKHITSVVNDLQYFVDYYELSRYNHNLLKTAALFHDIAFVKSHVNHEAESAMIAEEQLPKYGFGKDEIESVKNMILATKLPQSPNTFLEEILCDADLFYLGGKEYFEIAIGLKQEWNNIGFLKGDELQWIDAQLSFLKTHRYHTEFARTKLEPGKKKVIKKLQVQRNNLIN